MKKTRLSDTYIEFLKHPDNWFFIVLAIIGTAYLGYSGWQWMDLIWILVGWMIFLPQEYLTHVYILHAKVPNSERLYRWMYRLHYGHHDLPKRHDLMYMPLWLTLPMLAINITLFLALFSEPRTAITALIGLLIGYLVFEWTHLLYHMPYVPKTRIGNEMRRRHLMHHYLNENYWYTVSFPALPLDNLFGTMKHRDEVARSKTCSSLYLPPDHPFILKARECFSKYSSGDDDNTQLGEQCGK